MLLQQPHSFSTVIHFHTVNGKGIPETVRTDAAQFAGLWVTEFSQPRLLGTLAYDLPGSVTIEVEQVPLAVTFGQFVLVNIIPHHVESRIIQRQHSLSPPLSPF